MKFLISALGVVLVLGLGMVLPRFHRSLPDDNGINKEISGGVPHGNAALQVVAGDLFGVGVCLADDLAGLRDKCPFSVF